MLETIVETVNPATGKVIAKYQNMTDDQIREKVKNARSALKGWKNLDIGERCSLTRNLGRIMRRNKSEYAKLITEEMGKPVRQATAEVEKCAWLCDYYSETAEAFLRDELIPTEFRKSFVCFEPIGVVAGIMPWDFPFLQAMRFAVSAVAAGKVVILQHSSVCLGSAIKLEEAFTDAGFPENVFQAVIGNSAVGEALILSDIDAVSITGSVDTGKRVAELASKDLKKFVLELGGSDPFIVLDDADLNQTAYMATQSRLLNTGQSCIAAKRFIVVKEVADKFTTLFVENTQAEVVGDPLESKTTIISNVNHNMEVVREEVFGPAAPIIVVNNEEEAIMEANNSEFGLGASIWTNNIDRGIRLARQVESGIVSVNEMVKSDPRLPFGGVKKSGIGRELSEFGIKEFVNVKSVVVKDIASKLLVE